MKRRTCTTFVFTGLIVWSFAFPLRAQKLTILRIDVDSRSAAMGGVQLASPGQAMTVFTNPAGLAGITGTQVSTTLTNWLLDIQHFGGVAAYQEDGLGTVGISIIGMDYGTFDRLEPPAGYFTSRTVSVTEYVVGLAYARPLTRQWFMGGQVKTAWQRLPTATSGETRYSDFRAQQFLLLDIGAIYIPGWHDLRLGLTTRNLSRSLDPGAAFGSGWTDLGVAMDVLSLVTEISSHTLTTAFDWLRIPGGTAAQHLGIEYGVNRQFFLRGGYRSGQEQQGMTAGVGCTIAFHDVRVQMDFAYNDFSEYADVVHRFTIGVQVP